MNKAKLTVDAAYAFDYLSILEVKMVLLKNYQAKANYHACRDELCSQFGSALFFNIFLSNEYANLYSANFQIFNKIEAIRKTAKSEEILGKEIDSLNSHRAFLKGVLQKKFFNKEISEQKS